MICPHCQMDTDEPPAWVTIRGEPMELVAVSETPRELYGLRLVSVPVLVVESRNPSRLAQVQDGLQMGATRAQPREAQGFRQQVSATAA